MAGGYIGKIARINLITKAVGKFEGFNSTNGWPTRKTLESIGLKRVADTLQSKGKLG
jgi:hypothetical protein